MRTYRAIALPAFDLPSAPKPLASYVPAVRTGNLVFLEGPVTEGRVTPSPTPL